MKETIARLKKMQEWRRDDESTEPQQLPCTPEQFGFDIDRLIRFAECAEDIEWLKETALRNTHAAIDSAQEMHQYCYSRNTERIVEIHLAEIEQIKKIGEMK